MDTSAVHDLLHGLHEISGEGTEVLLALLGAKALDLHSPEFREEFGLVLDELRLSVVAIHGMTAEAVGAITAFANDYQPVAIGFAGLLGLSLGYLVVRCARAWIKDRHYLA